MLVTDAKPTHKRAYQKHGLRALEGALAKVDEVNWLEDVGPAGHALRAWRDDLIDDLGGPDRVGTAQRSIIETCCGTYLMLKHVDAWILKTGTLVNKRSRRLHPVIVQRMRLADSLAKHLSLLGLEKREVPNDLRNYIGANYSDEDKEV